MKKFKQIKPLVYVLMTLFAGLYVFDSAINLNPMYPEGAMFWCVLITAYTAVWCLFKVGANLGSLFSPPNEHGKVSLDLSALNIKSFPKAAKIIIIVPWVFFLVMSVYSTVLFNWKSYRDQLGQAEVQTFTSDIQPVDLTQVPIVDESLAIKLADKKLGEKPSLGSQVTLGKPTIQLVNDELIWAVPLYHSGFFKWITNLEGSAGYITVSATNVNDVEYVDTYKIKYQPGSYLLHDLGRYTRFTSAPLTGITDYSFELNDEGVPHWIITTYENQRGFALPEATGVIVVNATTGESATHAIADVPEWIDRVQPEYFIRNQINNQGEYVHGFLNFSDKDKFRASAGQAIIYNNDRCYLFTGLTSVGNDESSIGFMMVDMVTKEPLLYQMNGATERAAQSSAQGKVQNLGYIASFPLIINSDGVPTYFMTLKDQEGLIKQYAMVSVQNYSIVGVGETITETHRNYQTAMRQSGTTDSLAPTAGELKEITGTVQRIASQFDGHRTNYMLIFEEYPSKIFVIETVISNELALTKEGDQVTVGCYENAYELPIVQCVEFDNVMFTQE